MIGAPRPDVVEDNVVAIDLQAGSGCACSRSAHAEEHIVERCGIGLMAYARSACNTDLEEHWRIHRSCVNQQSGKLNAIHIGHGDCGRSRLRNKSRIAEAKHDRVWIHHIN